MLFNKLRSKYRYMFHCDLFKWDTRVLFLPWIFENIMFVCSKWCPFGDSFPKWQVGENRPRKSSRRTTNINGHSGGFFEVLQKNRTYSLRTLEVSLKNRHLLEDFTSASRRTEYSKDSQSTCWYSIVWCSIPK